MISNKAASVAVLVAFITGILGSLAVRSAAQHPGVTTGSSQASEEVRINWRVPKTSSRNMPVLGDTPHVLQRSVAEVSNGAVLLQMIEPGEIVPVFAITDAVRDGKVEAGFTWLGYDQGKIPASTLISAVPFSMEPIDFAAWWFAGGGKELGEKMYEPHNIYPVLCSLTGPETAGWFREPIENIEDFKGLKIRFAGLGGKVLEQAGASVTMLPAGEIFQALEKGAIDASEFALPIVDQSLGFARVAKFNYFPGWHQPFTAMHFVINLDEWKATSAADKALIHTACKATALEQLARTEAAQGEVIAGFPDIGVTASRLPDEILYALRDISERVLDESAANDATFNEVLVSQRAFLANYAHWKKLAYLPRDF